MKIFSAVLLVLSSIPSTTADGGVVDPDYYESPNHRSLWGCSAICASSCELTCFTDDDFEPGCIYSKEVGKGKGEGQGQSRNEGCVTTCIPESRILSLGDNLADPPDTISSGNSQGGNIWTLGEDWCNNNNQWRRVLVSNEEKITPKHARMVIEEKAGNPFGTVTTKEDIISEKSIQILKEYTKNAYAKDDFDPSKLPEWRMTFMPGTTRPNLPPEAQGNYYITGHELVHLVGKSEAKSLLDFFHEVLGEDAPVTSIKLQIGHNAKMMYYEPHVDLKSSMIVFLGGNDTLEGGGLGYYSYGGYEIINPAAGKAVIHDPDTVHQSEPFKGDRYIIDFQSKGPEHDCLLKQLVE